MSTDENPFKLQPSNSPTTRYPGVLEYCANRDSVRALLCHSFQTSQSPPPPPSCLQKVDDNASYTIKSLEEIKMETPQESREADEKPNSMEDTLKEAMGRMRKKHALRTAGLLESTGESAPPEDETVR